MRARDFIRENASTAASSAGGIATIATPMGMVARSGGSLFAGKYSNDPAPNTPAEYKRKAHARGKFKNSISN